MRAPEGWHMLQKTGLYNIMEEMHITLFLSSSKADIDLPPFYFYSIPSMCLPMPLSLRDASEPFLRKR